MWCDRCQSDVKADAVAATGQGAAAGPSNCSVCGAALTIGRTPGSDVRQREAVRQAHAILARWQSSDLLDRISAAEDLPPLIWNRNTPTPNESPSAAEAPAPLAPPTLSVLPAPPEVLTEEPVGQPVILKSSVSLPLPLLLPDAGPEPQPESEIPLPPTAEVRMNDLYLQAVVQVGMTGDSHRVPPSESVGAETDNLGPETGSIPGHLAIPHESKTTPDISGATDVNRKYRIDIPTGQQVDPDSVGPPDALPPRPTEAARPRQAVASAAHPAAQLSAPAKASPVTAAAASPIVSPVASSVAPETKLVSNAGILQTGSRFRIDAPEPVEKLTETEGTRTRTHGRPKRQYIDEAHGALPNGPHFQISPPRRTNLTSMTGQFLAYLGVLGLTVGTAMVIYGHFGGYAEYTPTGWLVTTVAQMMLFLGVINLVSGGIEQNNEEVSRRINSLGEQLVRIEQVTEQALRGPKLPPRMYADHDMAESVSARETVTAE